MRITHPSLDSVFAGDDPNVAVDGGPKVFPSESAISIVLRVTLKSLRLITCDLC